MDFQRNMWAEAWVQGVVARRFVALGIVGEFAIDQSVVWLKASVSPSIVLAWMLAYTLVWCFLAFAVHAQILTPTDHLSRRYNLRVFGFALRTVAILAVVWGVVIGAAFFPAMIPTLKKMLSYCFQTPVFYKVPVVAVWFLLVLIFVGLPLFVWLGTILPAYVAGRAGGVSVAFRRGKAQFGWIAARLLIGPFFLTALFVAGAFLPSFQVNDTGLFWSGEGGFQPDAFLWSVSNYAVSGFSVALTAVILSRAFLRAEGMSDRVPA